MSDPAKSVDVPETTHTFQLESSGKVTKRRYVGDFSCKIPTTKDQCQIAKHQAFLNGPMAEFLDPGTLSLHRKIAYLRFTLEKYPDWWRDNDLGYNLIDHNVVGDVYDKVSEFEEGWLKEIWGEEAIKGSDNGSAEKS